MQETHKSTSPSAIQVKNLWMTIGVEGLRNMNELLTYTVKVRLTHSGVRAICDDNDRIKESATWGNTVSDKKILNEGVPVWCVGKNAEYLDTGSESTPHICRHAFSLNQGLFYLWGCASTGWLTSSLTAIIFITLQRVGKPLLLTLVIHCKGWGCQSPTPGNTPL